MTYAPTDVYIKCKEESGCFSNWGDSATGCFPKDITWKCTNTGFTLTGSLSALYEHSNFLTPAQKLGKVSVYDTAEFKKKGKNGLQTWNFKSDGKITIEQKWDDLKAKPVHVKDKNQLQFSATIVPDEPILAKRK